MTHPAEDDELAALIADASRSVSSNEDGPPATPTPATACDVLIADDAGASRELLSAILRNFAGPLDIREARDGQEALSMWRNLRPHITLLDIDMPGVDGLTALQQLRAIAPDAFIAIVSGGSSIDNVKRALSLGAAGFVIKPYKPQRILDLLQRYRDKTGRDLLAR
jgi:two-component system, chemotaxis family, chemotaxis protein CheY